MYRHFSLHLGDVHTGVVFERFQKRFCPFNPFDAMTNVLNKLHVLMY
jgi:hypothetical protein